MDEAEELGTWRQHEGVLPGSNVLLVDHRHVGGADYHQHDEYGPTQLVVDSDDQRTVYGPDGHTDGPVPLWLPG